LIEEEARAGLSKKSFLRIIWIGEAGRSRKDLVMPVIMTPPVLKLPGYKNTPLLK
jgi:hypothetical protein